MADDMRRRKSDWKRQRLERLNKKEIYFKKNFRGYFK